MRTSLPSREVRRMSSVRNPTRLKMHKIKQNLNQL
jgi:hypothetical protein